MWKGEEGNKKLFIDGTPPKQVMKEKPSKSSKENHD
jgi:hypothetical protein